MLQRLEINNFAIIQSLSVEFGPGLSVITGETGAGKSILLEGLSLALGKRADLSVLKDSSQKAVIEALFYLPDMPFEAFFSQNDLDQEPELRLRRELTRLDERSISDCRSCRLRPAQRQHSCWVRLD